MLAVGVTIQGYFYFFPSSSQVGLEFKFIFYGLEKFWDYLGVVASQVKHEKKRFGVSVEESIKPCLESTLKHSWSSVNYD